MKRKIRINREKIIRARVIREFRKFERRTLKHEKEEIMNRCGRIHFYACVKEYFEWNGDIGEQAFDFLSGKKEIIHSMWELYLKHEALGFLTWEELDEMIGFWMEEKAA